MTAREPAVWVILLHELEPLYGETAYSVAWRVFDRREHAREWCRKFNRRAKRDGALTSYSVHRYVPATRARLSKRSRK